MKVTYRGAKVGITHIIKRLVAPQSLFPRIPVLHDTVYRYAVVPKIVGRIRKVLIAGITLFALYIPERPSREHGRFARHFIQKLYKSCDIVCQEDIVRKRIRGIDSKLYPVAAAFKDHVTLGIYKNCVVSCRDKKGDRDPHVGLIQIDRTVPVVEDPVLVLSEP